MTTDANHLTGKAQQNISYEKDFFDSGSTVVGYQYAEYSLKTMYPELEREAGLLGSYFKPGMVLDVGCAKGFMVLTFRRMAIKTWGVDISEYALSNAPIEIQTYLARVDINTESLPFQDAEFDLVTARGVLDYVWNLGHALDEFRRVLRPEGVLYISAGYVNYGKLGAPMPQGANSWIREVEQHRFRFLQRVSKQFCLDRLKGSISASRSIRARVVTKLLVCPFLLSVLASLLKEEKSRACLLFRAQQ